MAKIAEQAERYDGMQCINIYRKKEGDSKRRS